MARSLGYMDLLRAAGIGFAATLVLVWKYWQIKDEYNATTKLFLLGAVAALLIFQGVAGYFLVEHWNEWP